MFNWIIFLSYKCIKYILIKLFKTLDKKFSGGGIMNWQNFGGVILCVKSMRSVGNHYLAALYHKCAIVKRPTVWQFVTQNLPSISALQWRLLRWCTSFFHLYFGFVWGFFRFVRASFNFSYASFVAQVSFTEYDMSFRILSLLR